MEELNRREFANGFVAALALADGKKIETTASYLPMTTEMRGTGKTDNKAVGFQQGDWSEKFMVGVSTQSGCPIQCKFCAVNELTRKQGWRNLTADEIFNQVVWAIEQTGADPANAKLFRVLLTRMGEPALNIDNVAEAIARIKERWPFARVQVSTIGMTRLSQLLMQKLMKVEECYKHPFIELQFSVHTTDNDYRKWLQGTKVVNLEVIAEWCKEWMSSEIPREWTPTLNFSLAVNTPFVVSKLKDLFNPEHVFIKLSPINENKESDSNGLKSLFPNNNEV